MEPLNHNDDLTFPYFRKKTHPRKKQRAMTKVEVGKIAPKL
jgi:hypothetical protein